MLLSCFWPGGCVFGHGSFVVWGHHFRSKFIASWYKYILNKECIKGEEVEKVFSGSRIRHNWFVDFIILFRGFHILYNILFIYLVLCVATFRWTRHCFVADDYKFSLTDVPEIGFCQVLVFSTPSTKLRFPVISRVCFSLFPAFSSIDWRDTGRARK